jgi:hypothetical protein
MRVRKRRVYDITNVLEGIGLFHKTAKNKVGWRPQRDIKDLNMFNEDPDEESRRLPNLSSEEDVLFF